jgi:GalNAc5-diNAcBac-PP-undecaprenol beta-1,3-glucosyltransferase
MQSPVPFVSIIVPTHKRPVLLERALISIKSQECPLPYEIIVVSDEVDIANDVVCARVLGQNDSYIRRSGARGPAESRNLGITLASGQYILFLDDDDAWQPGLLTQLANAPAVKEQGFVYFDCCVATESRSAPQLGDISCIQLDLSKQLNELVYIKNQVHMSCFAFPRHLIGNTRFDSHMRAYEDWDFLLAIFDKSMPQHLPIQGSLIFEVNDESTDRRGNSQNASNFNAVMDYLYVYRRHPAPNEALRLQRADFLANNAGLVVPANML